MAIFKRYYNPEAKLFADKFILHTQEIHGFTFNGMARWEKRPRNRCTREVKLAANYILSLVSPSIDETFRRIQSKGLLTDKDFELYTKKLEITGFEIFDDYAYIMRNLFRVCVLIGGMAARFFGAGMSSVPTYASDFMESNMCFIFDKEIYWRKLQSVAVSYASCRPTMPQFEVSNLEILDSTEAEEATCSCRPTMPQFEVSNIDFLDSTDDEEENCSCRPTTSSV